MIHFNITLQVVSRSSTWCLPCFPNKLLFAHHISGVEFFNLSYLTFICTTIFTCFFCHLLSWIQLCSPNLLLDPPCRHFPKLPSNASTHFVRSNLRLVQPSDVTTLTTPGWVRGKNQHRCSLFDAHVQWLLVHPPPKLHISLRNRQSI